MIKLRGQWRACSPPRTSVRRRSRGGGDEGVSPRCDQRSRKPQDGRFLRERVLPQFAPEGHGMLSALVALGLVDGTAGVALIGLGIKVAVEER